MSKIIISIAFLTVFVLMGFYAHVQTCSVETEALKGTYKGGCKNGRAHGKGIATGEDSYNGEFKNGYPDGKGKYKWKNGDWYDGAWKKGVMEGKGEMHYANKTGSDTMKTGFWKKGKYAGKYENPYTIHSKTAKIGAVEVSLDTTLNNTNVIINADQVFGGKATLTNIQLINGRYLTQSPIDKPRLSVTLLQGVVFPFRAMFYYNTEHILDIELFETGHWTIDIRIN